jgi:hypothetical protein
VTATPSSNANGAAHDRLRIVSHFPGRVRVRAQTFRVLPEVAEEVSQRLLEEDGVFEAKIAKTTGSIVVSYDPRRIQLPRVVSIILRTGGLHGIEVDSPADGRLAPSRGGDRVRDAFHTFNESLRGGTKGEVDLKVAVPGALAAMGIGMVLAGRFVMPFWYDFVFWSFVTFHNMNPREARSVRLVDDDGADE